VVGIDYFLGDPIYVHKEENFDPYAWTDKARVKAEEITPKWVEDVRKYFGQYCIPPD
jgi:hypothetical protein